MGVILLISFVVRPHKNPALRVQKIENVNFALMSMKEERVPIVGIGTYVCMCSKSEHAYVI